MAAMTRREFLAHGALAGAAVTILPGCGLLSEKSSAAPALPAEAVPADSTALSKLRSSLNGHVSLPGGGGVGGVAREYGGACDNVLSVEVVNANAETVVARADQNQDLFWAMRGAGANFGIATAFEYRLHPVTKIFGGFIAYPASQA